MAYSQSDVDSIDTLLKTGVSRVEFQDRSQTNRSVAEELTVRNVAAIVAASPTPATPGGIQRRQYRMYSGKGWSSQ